MTYLPFGGTPFVGFGSVWVAPNCYERRGPVRRYDPKTRSVVATIHVPRVQAIAFGDGRVWAGSSPRSSSRRVFKAIPGTARVTEIDPRSNRIVGRPIRLPGDIDPDAIAVAGDDLWIADYQHGLLHFYIRR